MVQRESGQIKVGGKYLSSVVATGGWLMERVDPVRFPRIQPSLEPRMGA